MIGSRAWRRLVAPVGRWPRLVVAAACALIVVLYLSNPSTDDAAHPPGDGQYHPVLARGDGHLLYLMGRSTALDLDWNFDNDLARFGDPWNLPRTETGRKAIVNPIGPALVWTPMIWVAEAGAAIVNVFGAGIAMHGYTAWHQRIVFLSSALFACGAVLLALRAARRLVVGAGWVPAYATVAILLGTSLTYYATDMPAYSHAMDAFACAAFLEYWLATTGRRDLRRWIVLGALLGVAGLVRAQELGFGVVVAIEVISEATHATRERRWPDAARWLGGGAVALAVMLLAFAPQLVEWHVVFGHASGLPQGDRFTRPGAPMIAELLWSQRNGWFTSSPIAYAAVIGLGVFVARKRSVAVVGLAAVVVLQIYLNSIVFDWWSSASFGQRRMCNVTLPLVVGMAALLAACARGAAARGWPRWLRHALALVILGVPVVSNVGRVIHMRRGKAAPSDVALPCCHWVPAPLRGTADRIYGVIGDPFAFPANAVFAARHGVSLQRWDAVAGAYPWVPPTDSLLDDRLWSEHGHAGLGPSYTVAGFGPPLHSDRNFRWTTADTATLLVPNLMPYGQRVTLWLAPGGAHRATVRWNGDVVADVDLAAGWNAVTFDLPHIALHTNELAIDAPVAPATGLLPPWTAPAGPVGVAVNGLDLAFLPP